MTNLDDTKPIDFWPVGRRPHGPALGKIIHEAPALHPCKPGIVDDGQGFPRQRMVAPGSRWQCDGCHVVWYRHASGEWRREIRADSTIGIGFAEQPEQPMPRWMQRAFVLMAVLAVVTVVTFIVTTWKAFG